VNEIYNICGGYEQTNFETFKKIAEAYDKKDVNDYIDSTYNRDGQDLRYALNDGKLRNLGWSPTAVFDEELPEIIDYYKHNFIW
jgi:dTDP-glucose 4,6-dehydratase